MARLTTIGTSNGSFAGVAAKLLTAEAMQWVSNEDRDRDSDSVCMYYMLCW